MREEELLRLESVTREVGIPLLIARCYGLMGYVRVRCLTPFARQQSKQLEELPKQLDECVSSSSISMLPQVAAAETSCRSAADQQPRAPRDREQAGQRGGRLALPRALAAAAGACRVGRPGQTGRHRAQTRPLWCVEFASTNLSSGLLGQQICGRVGHLTKSGHTGLPLHCTSSGVFRHAWVASKKFRSGGPQACC